MKADESDIEREGEECVSQEPAATRRARMSVYGGDVWGIGGRT
jgi:hypothetical protein